jgi:8-oxo-dGTP diphosphatase
LKQLSDINWDSWQAKDPATLVFVIREGRILLIDKKTGLGKGKVNGPGGKVE